jgi:2',3'-cyclic-nucleotide 2'-phosphodiesterase/3'-nucleotidase
VKVGVLGLITPNVPGWETPEHYAGLDFLPMDEAARRWVPILRETEGCDLVVVLAHCGFERDLERGEPNHTNHENFGWRLTQVPGIDVLLTGHTHRDIPPREVNGVIVAQPAARATRLTRLDLDLRREADRWLIESWAGENLATAEAEADPEIIAALTPAHTRVARALDATVGEVTAEVRVDRCRLEDCAATDLLHAVQLEASGADLSLAALPNRYAPPLPAGPVSLRWVYAFYTYPNTLVAVRLTGSQVHDLLEHSARYYDGLRCEPEDGCTVLTDPEVRHYNVDTMAGISYRIDPTRPEGSRVRDLSYRGLPLDRDAVVTVVINSYRAAGGGLFPHLAEAEAVWRSSAEMTELIADYLQRHQPWYPATDGNWRLGRDMVAEEVVSAP